jgi:phenylpyruvate tautomerase PptA (4-oxalocrotonate tautomerase family)
MPLVHIALRRGKPAAYRAALQEGIYQALRETFDVPADDRFMIVTQHDADEFFYGRTYMDIARSDELVMIQLTVSDTRTVEKKQALFQAICERLTRDPGLRPEDVFINLVEVKTVNWSFGHGIAQYAS